VNRELAVLLSVVSWCYNKGIIKTSPFAGKKIKRLKAANKREVYFKADEWHRFIQVFTDREALLKDIKRNYRITGNQKEREAYLFNAGRAGDLFLTQLLTCCRIGELLSLRWSAVSFKTGSVSIKQWKQDDTKHQNLTPELRSIFERLEKVSSDKATGFVFERADGKPFPINQAETFFKVGVRLAGIQKYDGKGEKVNITPHGSRHTGISWMLQSDISPAKVQLISGHKDLASTMKYSKIETGDLDKALQGVAAKARQLDNTGQSENLLTVVKSLP
jgi:integrase